MTLEITTSKENYTVEVDTLPSAPSGVITIGQRCKQVWNAIAIDDETVDPFQCHLLGVVGGKWTLNNGQVRTECPKGLISSKTVPCNGCTGRCVNIHPGRPKYPQRLPETATLINGEAVGKWGSELKEGDVVEMGTVRMKASL